MESFKPATPEQYERIKVVADQIVDLIGVTTKTRGGLEYESALFAIGESELAGKVENDRIPTIKIDRATKDSTALWSYGITVGMQDEEKSKHILIGKDPLVGDHAVVTGYSEERSQDLLSQNEANKLIFDLESQIPESTKE